MATNRPILASHEVAIEDLLAESSDSEDDQLPHPLTGATAQLPTSVSAVTTPLPSKSVRQAQQMSELHAILRDEESDDEDGPPIPMPLPIKSQVSTTTRTPSTSTTTALAASMTAPIIPRSQPLPTPIIPTIIKPPTTSITSSPASNSPIINKNLTTAPTTPIRPSVVNNAPNIPTTAAPTSTVAPAPVSAQLKSSPTRPLNGATATSSTTTSANSNAVASSALSQSVRDILHDDSSDEDELPPLGPTVPKLAPTIPAAVPTPIQPPAKPISSSQPTASPTLAPSTNTKSIPAAVNLATIGINSDSEDDELDDAELRSLQQSVNPNSSTSASAAAAAIIDQDSSSDDDIDQLVAVRKVAQGRGPSNTASESTGTKSTAAPTSSSQTQLISDLDLALIANPLTRAEVLEQNLATLGNYQVVNPLAGVQASAASTGVAAIASTGKKTQKPANTNLVKLLSLDRISAELERLRSSIGLATTCCLHSKLFAVGTSRGFVIIFDHFESKQVTLSGKPEEERSRGLITCIDMNVAGDKLLVGYSQGTICLWDILNKSCIKVITDMYDPKQPNKAICSVRFTKQELKGANFQMFMAGDILGNLNLFKITKQLFSTNLEKQVLLVGKAGPVLSSSVLVSNPTFPHLCDHFALIAIATEGVTSIISLEPNMQIVFRMSREANERVGVLPILAWRNLQQRDAILNDPNALQALPSTMSGLEVELARHPCLAIARGRTLTLLQVAPMTEKNEANLAGQDNKPKVPLKFNTLHTQTFAKEIKSVNWLGNGSILVVILAPNDELLILDPYVFPLQPLMTLDGRGIGIVHSDFFLHPTTGAPELSFTPSISATDGSILLLGSEKVSELRVLTWTDRLDGCIHNTDDPHWIDCLALALDFYHGVAKSPFGLPRDKQSVQARLRDKMIELINSFIHVMLQAKEGSSASANGGATGDVDFLTGGRTAQLKSDKQYLKILGGTCIAYCISISRYDVLFGPIADKFKVHFPYSFNGTGSPVSMGTELFLELLEPYILIDQLTTLPVHILQDLFLLYHYKKRLPQLEQMLLHLNPLAVDLNFLIPMIKTYRLFSACIYMYNRGHSAFHSPLEEILGTLTQPSNLGLLGSLSSPVPNSSPLGPFTDSDKSKMSYKLLLYIDYCFRGRTFPRKAQELPKTYCAGVRAQVLSVLFRKNVTSSGDGTQAPVQLPDYPFLSYFLNISAQQFLDILSQVFEGDEEWMEYIETPKEDDALDVDRKSASNSATPTPTPPINTPNLQRPGSTSERPSPSSTPSPNAPLPNISPAPHQRQQSTTSLLFGLGASSSAPPPPPTTAAPPPKKRQTAASQFLQATGVPTRQFMLDALLFLMLDQLQYAPPSTSTAHAALLLPFTYQHRPDHLAELFRFAARYLARGVVTASPSFVNRIFTHLCTGENNSANSRIVGLPESVNAPLPTLGNAAAPSSSSSTTSAATAVQDLSRDQNDRQSTLLSLLARVPPGELEVESLLLRARGASFWMVQAYLTLVAGRRDFARTLDAMLRAVENKDMTVLPPTLLTTATADIKPALESMVGKTPVLALFDFIHQAINDPNLPPPTLAAMRTSILQRLPDLVKAASDRTARLILEDFSQEHERVVSALNAFPELQFRYLQSIMTGPHTSSHHRAESTTVNESKHAEDAPMDIHSSNLTSGRLGGATALPELSMTELLQRSGLQFTPKVHELYIKLLCTYAPNSVLAHISSHQDYPIESALKLCQEYHVDDASAYLLERTGDVQGALELTLQAVDSRIVELRQFLDANWRAYPVPVNGSDVLSTSSTIRRQSSADSTVLSASGSTKEVAPKSLVTSPQYLNLNKQILNTINTATLLCQRSMDSEKLWFALLDRFVTLLRTLKAQEQQQQGNKRPSPANVDPARITKANQAITALPMESAVGIYLQSSLYSYVHLVLASMMQHLELSSLLTKITTDHQSDTLREFRETIQGLLDTYSYEESILATANNLLSSDKFHSIVMLHRKKAAAFIPKSESCGCCARAIGDGQSSSRFVLFDCGHIFHDSCLGKQSDSCMICQRESAAAAKKRTTSRANDKKSSSSASSSQPSPSNKLPVASPSTASASASASDIKSRALGAQNSDELIHRLILAERKFKKGSCDSINTFNTKLKQFGRGGLEDDDNSTNDDDFDSHYPTQPPSKNPFASPTPASSSSSTSTASRTSVAYTDDDDFNFHLPNVRTGLSMSKFRTPGSIQQPTVVRRLDVVDYQ